MVKYAAILRYGELAERDRGPAPGVRRFTLRGCYRSELRGKPVGTARKAVGPARDDVGAGERRDLARSSGRGRWGSLGVNLRSSGAGPPIGSASRNAHDLRGRQSPCTARAISSQGCQLLLGTRSRQRTGLTSQLADSVSMCAHDAPRRHSPARAELATRAVARRGARGPRARPRATMALRLASGTRWMTAAYKAPDDIIHILRH
jgi:hypothetical protein